MPKRKLDLLTAATSAAMRAPEWLISATAGPPITIDGRTLERATQYMLLFAPGSLREPGQSVAYSRRRTDLGARVVGVKLVGVTISSLQIPGADFQVATRVYRPNPPTENDRPESSRAIVYYHGGGWAVGSLASHDSVARALSLSADATVISVDYRMAPEHRFPAAVNDCISAYKWIREQARSLGIDPSAIAVMGDSAGGNLAAVVAQQCRDRDIHAPALQALVYPATDLTFDASVRTRIGDDFYLTVKELERFRKTYLLWDSSQEQRDPMASPLFGDLVDLPPALVWTAGFDPLRDQGLAYAEALTAAGNRVYYHCYDDQTHGFLNFLALPGALARVGQIGAQVGAALDLVRAPHQSLGTS
jgi:acetyl esterase